MPRIALNRIGKNTHKILDNLQTSTKNCKTAQTETIWYIVNSENMSSFIHLAEYDTYDKGKCIIPKQSIEYWSTNARILALRKDAETEKLSEKSRKLNLCKCSIFKIELYILSNIEIEQY